MNKKQLKQLATASFVKGGIDPKRVIRITSKLKKSEIRVYIKYLKAQIAASRVRIQVPNVKNINVPEIKKQFSKLYPKKKLVIEENPQLLLGMKIIDDDKIYDFNLKDSFESLNDHFAES